MEDSQVSSNSNSKVSLKDLYQTLFVKGKPNFSFFWDG